MADIADDLRDAISDTFKKETDLDELVAKGTNDNWSLDEVAQSGELRFRITRIVRHARDHGWLLELVDALSELRPGSERVAKLKSRADFRREVEPGDPFAAVFIRGRPLVDRSPLRDALRRLDAGTGTPFLVIDGEPKSGKSYSATLINYVKSRRPTLRLALVELDALGQDGEVKPAHVGASIARQLGLGPPAVATGQQEARWAIEFCEWFVGVLPPADACWIVIDGFGKAGLSTGVRDLVKALGKSVSGPLSNVRLVLIEYDERAELEALTRTTEYESVTKIPLEMIAEGLKSYFEVVYKEHANTAGMALTKEALDPRVDESVQTVIAAMLQSDSMAALGRAAEIETRRIADLPPAAPPGGP